MPPPSPASLCPMGVLLWNCVLLGWAEGVCNSDVDVKFKTGVLLLLLELRVQIGCSPETKINQT